MATISARGRWRSSLRSWSRSAAMPLPIRRHAAAGGLVFGICNGFQVLTETGLLPGALMRNEHLRFLGRDVFIRVEETDTPFTCELERGAVLRVPIAHGEGNYFADDIVLDELERNRQV